MFKKFTSIFFILLANIVLLVHSVVPHHHHKAEVCIDNSHCESEADNHNYSCEENNHEHDSSNNNEYCILKQLVVTKSNFSKRTSLYSENNVNPPQFNFFQDILLSAEKESLVPLGIKTQPPQFITYYSFLVNTSLSLRGPPTV